MHPKAEAYIQEKETKRKAIYEAGKQKFLEQENLTDFVPNPNHNVGYTDEYPYRKPDPETGEYVFGKMAPIEVTDDEYELLRTASGQNSTTGRNKVASVLQYIAYAIYALSSFSAFIIFVSEYKYLWSFALVSLVTGLISGTIFLGFAEIIKLLQKISDKLK